MKPRKLSNIRLSFYLSLRSFKIINSLCHIASNLSHHILTTCIIYLSGIESKVEWYNCSVLFLKKFYLALLKLISAFKSDKSSSVLSLCIFASIHRKHMNKASMAKCYSSDYIYISVINIWFIGFLFCFQTLTFSTSFVIYRNE